jgi:hypothetical protein
MTFVNAIPVSPLVVAVDISKHRHEVLIWVPGKPRRRRLAIRNSLEDFERLVAVVREYGLQVRIGFEATGNNYRALAHHLGAAGIELKAALLGWSRSDSGSSPQQLEQERPEGRSDHSAHAGDRRDPVFPRSAGRGYKRHSAAFQNARDHLAFEGRIRAPAPDPLPAAVFSRSRAILSQRTK